MGENSESHISDKGLIFIYIKNSYNSTILKKIKCAEDMNRLFPKDEI